MKNDYLEKTFFTLTEVVEREMTICLTLEMHKNPIADKKRNMDFDIKFIFYALVETRVER